jgi:hypothetical protein
MDSFYEESAVNQKAKRGEVIYKVVNVFFWLFTFVAIIFAMLTLMSIPYSDGNTSPEAQESYAFAVSMFIFWAFCLVSFAGMAVLLWFLKRRINVSFDYLFVSGELRISKVFNVNKRKLVARIESENVLKVGDVDSASYDRIKSDPSTKEVICTPNLTAGDGKFFMYVQAVDNGVKKLYVLECRETMLVNMMQFLRRDVLADDYISQAKKQSV